MITNFEEITSELTDAEKIVLPILINGLKKFYKDKPIKAPIIVAKINEAYKVDLTEPRLRKLINHIRVNSLLPIIATSNGYFVSTDRQEIEKQIRSLEERARSIQKSADGLKKILSTI